VRLTRDAITAIKAALEAKNEPVAWLNPYGGVLQRLDTGLEKSTYTIPLYTTPPQQEAKDEPMKKLQVTLEDRPVDIELAQYKRMFEDACSTLGAVSHALGCDPDEGGAEPLLAAIEELKGQTTPPQRRPLTDEEIDKVMAENKQTLIDATDNYWNMRRAYARIIEAAHGIKELP
jgi:hypothetical protein